MQVHRNFRFPRAKLTLPEGGDDDVCSESVARPCLRTCCNSMSLCASRNYAESSPKTSLEPSMQTEVYPGDVQKDSGRTKWLGSNLQSKSRSRATSPLESSAS